MRLCTKQRHNISAELLSWQNMVHGGIRSTYYPGLQIDVQNIVINQIIWPEAGKRAAMYVIGSSRQIHMRIDHMFISGCE
jgi:hypothetical protein